MSRSYIARFVSPDQLAVLRRNLKQSIERVLMAAIPGVDIITRDLVPTDFATNVGTVTGQFTNQVLGSSTAYVQGLTTNVAIPFNKAWAIYGITDLAAVPTLMEVQFLLGTSATMAQIRMDAAYASGVNTVLFDPPLLYKPLDTFNPKFLFNAATAASAEAISFIGIVAEPAGITVSLPPDHAINY
jgi:hypothetical protein